MILWLYISIFTWNILYLIKKKVCLFIQLKWFFLIADRPNWKNHKFQGLNPKIDFTKYVQFSDFLQIWVCFNSCCLSVWRFAKQNCKKETSGTSDRFQKDLIMLTKIYLNIFVYQLSARIQSQFKHSQFFLLLPKYISRHSGKKTYEIIIIQIFLWAEQIFAFMIHFMKNYILKLLIIQFWISYCKEIPLNTHYICKEGNPLKKLSWKQWTHYWVIPELKDQVILSCLDYAIRNAFLNLEILAN